MKKKNFTDLVLVVGVIAGIFLAIFSSIKETNFQIEEDWVARVGDAKISKTKYFLQLEGLALDSKDSLDNKDKAFVQGDNDPIPILCKQIIDFATIPRHCPNS